MSAFWYSVALQWKLDIRSKALLITCYVVPLLFFVMMGGIFTSVNPMAKETLVQSMTVLGVSMGALIGLPPTLLEAYQADRKKMYQANGIPMCLGLVSMFLSALIHLLILCAVLSIAAPLLFDAVPPSNPPLYFCVLVLLIAGSLSLGGILGLAVKNQAKLTMISQLVFLPSIMLSGILFPIDLLPKPMKYIGKIFPAAWGYPLLVDFRLANLWPLLAILAVTATICAVLLKRKESEL